MVAPLVEALLLGALRRRAAAVPVPPSTRLVGERHTVDSLGYVTERTSVLLRRPGRGVEVLGPGSVVLPSLLGTRPATYVVVTHDPVEVWLRIGPFETRDDRTVQQVELNLTVALEGSTSVLRELVEATGEDADGAAEDPDRLAETVLDRLAREVADRTTEAVRARTLDDLTSLSLAVLLDAALPSTFVDGLLTRSALEVVDVDWPTEGRGWPRPPAPVPVPGLGSPRAVVILDHGWVAVRASEPALASPWPGRELVQVRRTVRQAATLALAVLLAVQWLFVVAGGLPETAVLPAHDWWLRELGVLSVLRHPFAVGLLLACSAAFCLLVRRGQALGRLWLVAPVVLGTLVTLALLVGSTVGGLTGGALSVIVLLVWLASTWWALAHAVLAGLAPRRAVAPRTGAVLVAAWVVLLPGPLAVGRWMLAPGLRIEAAALAANTEGLGFAALLTGASVRLFLFGALLGVVGWLAYQCWPRPVGRRSWRWYAALGLAFVALVELWWTAQTVADRRVTELRYGDPARELHFTCATWVYPPDPDAPAATPTQTVAVSGSSCSTVTAYAGYHQLGTSPADVSVSPVALRRPAPAGTAPDAEGGGPLLSRPATGPAGSPKPLVGARYGDVVVLAGSNRFDRTADQLVAVSVRGGPALWRFVCGEKREVRARFAGGQADPASTATAPGDPGDVVVLTCGARRLRFDPVTGLTPAR